MRACEKEPKGIGWGEQSEPQHGQPIVRLCGVEKTKTQLASRARFRAQLPRLAQSSASLIRSLRDEEC
ncbi:hypothetical protein AGMMS50256_16410 [Betaproteobacteria bacterium]|nr:hypothetical protein AGMMS50256_16410 [Betaproteobacteria bacterium]